MRTLSEKLEIFNRSDLYPVVSSEFCNGRNVCDIVEGIASGGAKIVQIREKNISDSAMFELVKKCRLITERSQMLLIVDDRVDIFFASSSGKSSCPRCTPSAPAATAISTRSSTIRSI